MSFIKMFDGFKESKLCIITTTFHFKADLYMIIIQELVIQ